jgi:hypothetical protein
VPMPKAASATTFVFENGIITKVSGARPRRSVRPSFAARAVRRRCGCGQWCLCSSALAAPWAPMAWTA